MKTVNLVVIVIVLGALMAASTVWAGGVKTANDATYTRKWVKADFAKWGCDQYMITSKTRELIPYGKIVRFRKSDDRPLRVENCKNPLHFPAPTPVVKVVEKIVEVPTVVEKLVEVPTIVEKLVEVPTIVEKIVEVPTIVEKLVEVEKIVERTEFLYVSDARRVSTPPTIMQALNNITQTGGVYLSAGDFGRRGGGNTTISVNGGSSTAAGGTGNGGAGGLGGSSTATGGNGYGAAAAAASSSAAAVAAVATPTSAVGTHGETSGTTGSAAAPTPTPTPVSP